MTIGDYYDTRFHDYQYERGFDLLATVDAAGGWNRYVQRPWFELVCLRKLCIEGRATFKPRPMGPWVPTFQTKKYARPSLLVIQLFGLRGSPSRLSRDRTFPVLPPELFRSILEYWWWG